MKIISTKIHTIIRNILKRLGLINSSFYINGPETLPEPLSAEGEAEVMALLSTERAEYAKEQLIVHNLRLVVYIARKYDAAGASVEDLISIGTIGLIKAVNTFCPERNIKLATYASRCIENEILMYMRKSTVLKTEISIDEPLNVDWDGNELLLSDILGSDGNEVGGRVEQEDEKRLLNILILRLDDREREIMNMRFGLSGQKEHTQKEVADILGISQSYISRLEKRIIARLKKEMERSYI
ncbi:MAG: sigma-70 family RNA polymerase sigma factor [Clostridia bacterium]|nr:sigma-70 family RNA polymerase sigma factor [Clostridia bacterium]